MKIILLERLGRHGGIGDEVSVKAGYARNFLLPQGKALRATAPNRAKFESERATIEKRNEDRKEEAAGIAAGLNGHSVIMIRQAGVTGQLYGSVSSRDISEALERDGFAVTRSLVDQKAPIKNVGVHSVALNLHPEIAVNVTINVARTEDEALRQAKGEDLTVFNYDDNVPDEAVEAVDEDAVAVEVADGEESERQENA